MKIYFLKIYRVKRKGGKQEKRYNRNRLKIV